MFCCCLLVHRTGTLHKGYRILAINGESLFEKTLDDAVRMLKASGDQVTLKISKGVRRKGEWVSKWVGGWVSEWFYCTACETHRCPGSARYMWLSVGSAFATVDLSLCICAWWYDFYMYFYRTKTSWSRKGEWVYWVFEWVSEWASE